MCKSAYSEKLKTNLPILTQRLAKRKQKKQVELDKCAFDPEHMEESHNGGSFPMVSYFCL